MDTGAWETRHGTAYGCTSWERACRQGDLLVAWYDERQIGRRARPKWPWRSALNTEVARLLWRTAREGGSLVDDVPLADAARYDAAESPTEAGRVVRAHLADGTPRHRPPGSAPTLGYRVRELRATPDWEHGDWTESLTRARRAMRRADDLRASGAWRPTAEDRSAGRRTGLDRDPPGSTTAAPADPVPGRLGRASRLVRLGPVLSAVAGTLSCADGGRPGPVAEVLEAAARACEALRAGTEEVERLWEGRSHEPADPAEWELSRVPPALKDQAEETEDLLRVVAAFLWTLACG
ncbi:hypothetical protein [Kitasatospora sp. NPDC088346]|uniref:hypothetical protein n=1 Tax=Kitasatospora sp. NPDC088346 TaxID=3364073 RepID=UPI0037F1A45E